MFFDILGYGIYAFGSNQSNYVSSGEVEYVFGSYSYGTRQMPLYLRYPRSKETRHNSPYDKTPKVSQTMTVRILLVDDEPSLAGVMELYLRKFIEDFEIVPALNGREAVETVKELMELGTPPDLTLMDLRMPAMDGIECTKVLTEMGLRNIHILSAYVDANLLTEAQSVGAKGVLKKSEGFKTNALKVAEMVRVIRKPNPAA